MKDILLQLAAGPKSQLDPSIGDLLRRAADAEIEERKALLHEALDRGARYSLCSDFVMAVLDGMWKGLGGRLDDPAPWRNEMEEIEMREDEEDAMKIHAASIRQRIRDWLHAGYLSVVRKLRGE